MITLASAASFLGTIWFSALVFVAGALIGAPAWNWAKSYMPCNKG